MLRVVTLIAAAGLAIATTGCTSRSQFEGDWVCEDSRARNYAAIRVGQDRAYFVSYSGGDETRGEHMVAQQVLVPFRRSSADTIEQDESLQARSTNAMIEVDRSGLTSFTLERKADQLHLYITSLVGVAISDPRLAWVCKPLDDPAVVDRVQSSVAEIDRVRPQMQALLKDEGFVACLRIDPSRSDQCAVAKKGTCAAYSEESNSLANQAMALAFGPSSALARMCTGNTYHLPPLNFTADLTDHQFEQKLEVAFRAPDSSASEGGPAHGRALSLAAGTSDPQESPQVTVDSQTQLQQARIMPQEGQIHAVEGGEDGAGPDSTGSTSEGRSLFALEQVLRRGSSTESEWLGAMERLTSQDGGLASYRGMRVKEIFPPVFDRSTGRLLSFQLAFDSRSYDMGEVRDAFGDQCGEMWEVTDVSSRASSQSATCAVLYDPRVERVIAVVAKPSVQGPSARSSASATSDASNGWLFATINDPDGFTNVRSSPNGSAPIIGRVLEGQRFKVEASTGDWWKVQVEGVGDGYMHRSRIELDRSGNN